MKKKSKFAFKTTNRLIESLIGKNDNFVKFAKLVGLDEFI